jgi:dienelactone hydrolase
MNIRAFFRAVKVESAQTPYDTIHLKVTYPGKLSGSDLEHNLGVVPPDEALAPFPIVIFFSGFNCEAQTYQWLAVKLAQRGLVVVTFNWLSDNIPGMVSLTPGVDITGWNPKTYGSTPTASALPAILSELEKLQYEGILAGMLDLNKIILGGHSAGGRVAIENANPRFFRQVVAAFAYGAHTLGSVELGHAPGTILPLPDALPLLLMGGTCDGVIAESSKRYGIEDYEDATIPIVRTFAEAIAGGREDSYLILLEGANHFSISYPLDTTTARPFLDRPSTQNEDQIRSFMADAIALFIDIHVRQKTELSLLKNTTNPLIKVFECK